MFTVPVPRGTGTSGTFYREHSETRSVILNDAKRHLFNFTLHSAHFTLSEARSAAYLRRILNPEHWLPAAGS